MTNGRFDALVVGAPVKELRASCERGLLQGRVEQ